MTTPLETESFELSESDIAELASTDAAPLRCKQPGCGTAVRKPARGRTPDYCEDHKRSANRSNKGAGGKSWPRATEIENHLTETVIALGKVTALMNPFDGEHIQSHGPKVVHELVELAKDDKTLQRYLIWLASPGKYGPLIMATGGLVGPIALNHGAMNLIPGYRKAMQEAGGE